MVNTGTDYTEANSIGCDLNANNGVAGGIATQGRMVIRGDDPANPTRMVVTYNGDLFTHSAGVQVVKFENLDLVRNAAGTAGIALIGSAVGGNITVRNVRVSNTSGTWGQAFELPGTSVVIDSLFDGAFTTNCASIAGDSLIMSTILLGCSGSTSATLASVGTFMFSVLDNGGANQSSFTGSTNNGAGGVRMYNTLLNAGGNGVVPGANFDSIYSGNLISEGATLSGACFNGGTAAANLLGAATMGSPSNIWRGNAANTCTTARYGGGLDTSTEGEATDILAGLAFDPQFVDEPTLNLFPDNADAKSDLVFPGAAFPLLTPAEPVSTMTVGAAQRSGGGGVTAYAY